MSCDNISISKHDLTLDEATSALDNITQKKIADTLNTLRCTRIVIAHRLSTIRHCDRIIVLDGGKIVEDGTYEQLPPSLLFLFFLPISEKCPYCGIELPGYAGFCKSCGKSVK